MILKVQHGSPVPLRAQVEQLLRDLAMQADHQNGALLPDEVTLAAKLGVSRGTVRSGISKLVFEGVLERKAGVGTRVSTRNLESGITAWRSFTREMASKGVKVENYRIDFQHAAATPEAARALIVDVGTMLWRLHRVRGWNGQPILQSISWFHPRISLQGNENTALPLYEMIEKETGVRPKKAKEEFLAFSADGPLAKRLNVTKGAPLLLRRHTVFDQGGRPFEYAEVCYVSSRFALTMDMRREES